MHESPSNKALDTKIHQAHVAYCCIICPMFFPHVFFSKSWPPFFSGGGVAIRSAAPGAEAAGGAAAALPFSDRLGADLCTAPRTTWRCGGSSMGLSWGVQWGYPKWLVYGGFLFLNG